jgi:hypothetical protein
VSFAAINLCVASQRVFIVVVTYFVMTQSGNFWIHPRMPAYEEKQLNTSHTKSMCHDLSVHDDQHFIAGNDTPLKIPQTPRIQPKHIIQKHLFYTLQIHKMNSFFKWPEKDTLLHKNV